MAAAFVTYTNLFQEAWNNVYTLINNKSNVADPTTASTTYRKWIYSREPDVKSAGFSGYPFIIINPATIDMNSDLGKKSLDMKRGSLTFSMEIEIVTSDRGYNNMDGRGLEFNDEIATDIMETFNSATNRGTLSNNGLPMGEMTTTAVSTEAFHDTLVYRRSILLMFKSRKRLSA